MARTPGQQESETIQGISAASRVILGAARLVAGMEEQLALLTQFNAHLTQLHLQLPGKDQPAMAPAQLCTHCSHERRFNSRNAEEQKCQLWGGMLCSRNAGSFQDLRKVSWCHV